MHDCAESIWFFVYDSISYVLDKLWVVFVALVCFPVAVFGLIFDWLRSKMQKVRNKSLTLLVPQKNKVPGENRDSKTS